MDGDQTTDTMQNGTSRERPESAPYLRLKYIQGTTIENIQKKCLVKKLHIVENPKKDPLGSINLFYKPKTSKNSKGYALI